MSVVPLSDVAVHLRPQDNVAVVTKPIQSGAVLDHQGAKLTVSSRIGMGTSSPYGRSRKARPYTNTLRSSASPVKKSSRAIGSTFTTSALTPLSAITPSAGTARRVRSTPRRVTSRVTTAGWIVPSPTATGRAITSPSSAPSIARLRRASILRSDSMHPTC